LRTIAVLAGFDPGVLAAEAEIALEMENTSGDSMGFLFDACAPREMLHWNNIPEELTTIRALADLVGSTSWVSDAARMALVHGELGVEAATLLDKKLSAYDSYQRIGAALLIIMLEPEQSEARVLKWKNDQDVILRRAAAICMAASRPPDELEWAFKDP